ncbi:hypothetical protein PMAYCL1PPCAC_13073, partial [Pristionchus mayeri]
AQSEEGEEQRASRQREDHHYLDAPSSPTYDEHFERSRTPRARSCSLVVDEDDEHRSTEEKREDDVIVTKVDPRLAKPTGTPSRKRTRPSSPPPPAHKDTEMSSPQSPLESSSNGQNWRPQDEMHKQRQPGEAQEEGTKKTRIEETETQQHSATTGSQLNAMGESTMRLDEEMMKVQRDLLEKEERENMRQPPPPVSSSSSTLPSAAQSMQQKMVDQNEKLLALNQMLTLPWSETESQAQPPLRPLPVPQGFELIHLRDGPVACVFCDSLVHPSVACHVFPTWAQRNQIRQRKKLCWNCLGYYRPECRDISHRRRCTHCYRHDSHPAFCKNLGSPPIGISGGNPGFSH